MEPSYSFAAKIGPRLSPGPILVLHVEDGRANLVTPRASADRRAKVSGFSVAFGPVVFAIAASALALRFIRVDPALLFLGSVLGVFVVVMALSDRINSWTASYLYRHLQSQAVLTVKAVRPVGIRWTSVRAIADGVELDLSVNGRPGLVAEALQSAGFTARKTKRGA